MSETGETRRQQLRRLLEEGPVTLRELARAVGLRLVETAAELRHVERSVAPRRIDIDPATCEECGFVFRDRRRYTTPSRCPKCRSERIGEPFLRLPWRAPP